MPKVFCDRRANAWVGNESGGRLVDFAEDEKIKGAFSAELTDEEAATLADHAGFSLTEPKALKKGASAAASTDAGGQKE